MTFYAGHLVASLVEGTPSKAVKDRYDSSYLESEDRNMN